VRAGVRAAVRDGVWVTGIGLVSPIGAGRVTFWAGALAGRRGFAPVTRFDPRPYGLDSAYAVPSGAVGARRGAGARGGGRDGPHEGPHEEPRVVALLLAAGWQALADAGLARRPRGPAATRCAVVAATGIGASQAHEATARSWHAAGQATGATGHAPGGSPVAAGARLGGTLPGDLAPTLALAAGFAGPVLTLPVACAAGGFAIAAGFDLVRAGRADVVLAGGVDELSEVAMCGFSRLASLDPAGCRPFDRDRRGIGVGEGAAVLVLERATTAAARGARPVAAVLGYGLSADAHHITAPDPSGAGIVHAMRRALDDAGVTPADVGCVSAHGTGTPAGDRVEAEALAACFGARAGALPVTSIKGAIGHTGGAAAAFGAAVAALALAGGLVPPCAGTRVPDPSLGVNVVVERPQAVAGRVAIVNAFAFGGSNISLVLGACRGPDGGGGGQGAGGGWPWV